ncbi:cell division protein DedD [Xenorhabdus budapestensis]|uniref:Cell division protein DedD n=1 Tax=Xenorhabdus budapestensis TaxID=290110 RepID=A0A2D0IXG0_XENBU|nr:cell division protein DedD [Xenorhabdus budapestensis]PHM26598.1 cell division protein DedD [Xenorhabdus budapestensis]QTL41155.1 cell division protein DedD [Xenorhabdus budapestensis]
MASKFQNRLVGTIVLVALSVIVLPMLFDGDKKYNEEKFASIPLVPKPGDEENIDSIPPLTQSMPSTPPEGAAEAMQTQTQEQQSGTDMLSDSSSSESAPRVPPPVTITKDPKQARPESSSMQKVETKPEARPQIKSESRPASRPEAKPQPVEQAPQAVAYVVQLGALKNADKVNEIVTRLRLSGHQVYTIPSSPVQGQLTRIYVGPNASRQALAFVLPELKESTGLQGQIKNYKP